MSTKSFIKVRILAAIIGGLVSGGIFFLANTLLDTSFSKSVMIASSVVIAILFFFIVKPKQK